jgi:hypothetical protein
MKGVSMVNGENIPGTSGEKNNDNAEQFNGGNDEFDRHRAEVLRELDSKEIKGLSDTQKKILLENPDAILAQQEGGVKSNGIMSKDLVPDSENPDIRALFESGAVSITENGQIHVECLEKGQQDFAPDEKLIFAYEPLNDENGNRVIKDGIPQWNVYNCSGATVYEDRGDGPRVYKVPAPVIFIPTEAGIVPPSLEGIAHIDEATGELVIPREEGSEPMRGMPGPNTMLQIRKDFKKDGYDGKGATLFTKSQGVDGSYKVILGKHDGERLSDVLGVSTL